MSVAETSLQAFTQQVELTEEQQKVLEVIETHGPITADRIAKVLGKPHHCISGRPGELEELGKVKVTGKEPNTRGNPAKAYEVVK